MSMYSVKLMYIFNQDNLKFTKIIIIYNIVSAFRVPNNPL